MDIVSHALLGAAIVKDQNLLVPALAFGAGPDILNGIPVHIAMFRRLRNEGKSWRDIFSALLNPQWWLTAPTWTHASYLHMHSLFFAGLISLALYIIHPPWLILMKAWFLHIGIDIFTHREWFATRPFYPLSNWHVDAFNWFESPLRYAGIVISAFVLGIVYFKL